MRRCAICKEEKPVDTFRTYVNKCGNKKVWPYCPPCDYGKAKKWRQDNPEKAKAASRKAYFKSKYGLTLEELQAMLDSQDGACAVCGTNPTAKHPLVVDHDHETGAVRGMLCHNCNRGLGMFKDNVGNLASAISYLTR